MLRFGLPLVVFVALVGLLGVGLGLNPRLVPSPFIGKAVPEFSLPALHAPQERVGSADLGGRVVLLNVWATWCVGCREEHGLLLEVAREHRLPIYGINYKDERPAALEWLRRLGDPYVASAFDADGRVGIDLGVYGLPETFVIDTDGTIAYKHIGPLSPAAWRDDLLPVIRRLRAGKEG